MIKKILKLATTDFKIIFRDASIRSFLALPAILFVLIVWAVPPLVEKYDFLIPYLPLFLVFAVIENTQTFCFISTMVLIEEKETEVAKVYGVVPLTNAEYIVSRFLIPYLFTVLSNVILFLVQPLFEVSLEANLLISFLAALVVPVYVLSINAIVQNRMQGMVYIKAFNMIVLLPIAAFFVPENIVHLFGIFPTHWIFQSIENVTQGLSAGLMLGIGFVFFSVLVLVSSKWFIKRHFV
jgi:fluoroquinolone transport system permease protein